MKIQHKKKRFLSLSIVIFFLTIIVVTIFGFNKSKDDDLKLAIRKGGTYDTEGDLWLFNEDASKSKRITRTGNVSKVYSWSPDNKYIAISDIDRNLSVVELRTGKIKNLKEKIQYSFNPVWFSDDYLVNLTSDNRLLKIRISDGYVENFVSYPSEVLDLDPYPELSQDMKWLAIQRSSFDAKNPSISTYNFDNKLFKSIYPNNRFQLNGWSVGWYNNMLVYGIHNRGNKFELWKSKPDGSKREIQLSLTLKGAESAVSLPLVYFSDDEFLLNIISDDKNVNSKLVLYNSSTKVMQEINLEEIINDSGNLNNNYNGARLANFGVSSDKKYISFTTLPSLRSFIYTINIKSGKVSKVCSQPANCFFPVWSN